MKNQKSNQQNNQKKKKNQKGKKNNQKNQNQKGQRGSKLFNQIPKSNMKDVIICLAESVQRKGPPSSFDIFSKYDEDYFDYSIIQLGQQIAAGKIKNSTDICVRLVHSLEVTFRDIRKDLDKREYVSELRKKIRTVKSIFLEFIAENEVFEQVFEYFQELIEYLNRKTENMNDMKKTLLSRTREYISEKFIDSDILLLENAESLVKNSISFVL